MSNLQKSLGDLDNFKTRSEARRTLVEMDPLIVGQALIDKAFSECPENTLWALVDIFREWKWSGATEALLQLMDKETPLQMDICNALREIADLDLEADVDLWRKMLESPGIFLDLKKGFVVGEFLSFDIHHSYCSIVLPLPQSRRQEVLVYEKEKAVSIYTECGEINQGQRKLVEDFDQKLTWAELAIVEEGLVVKVTLAAEVHQESSDSALLKASIVRMAELADSLEEQLTGKDKI